ncbi:MFS transporter [Rhodobacterales bacterium HKCCE2091]|nr:MFS transporter [Rhodobacterales bacterium HKCCE2091]
MDPENTGGEGTKPSTSPFAPFANRRYLTYWLTGLSANFGWLITMVAASWMMTSIGGTPELVALVQTSIALPVMLFSLLAGALADVFGRRTTVLWSQSFLLVVSVALAVVSFLGLLGPAGLLVFTFLIGTGRALNNPGWQTFVGEFVPRRELPSAIALNSVGFNLARSLGPAIGGVIVATVGAFAAFAVNAAANLVVLFAASRWRSGGAERQLPPEPVGEAMLAGLRYVAMSPEHLRLLLRAGTFNLAGSSVMALMPLVARDLVGGGPQTYGLLLGFFGIGAIAAALFAPRFRIALPGEARARVTFLGFAAATLLLGLSRVLPLTLLACALAGACFLLTLSTFSATVQMSSPRWVVTRCQALYMSTVFGGSAVGSWIWGHLAGGFGLTVALSVSALAMVGAAAVGIWVALRDLDTDLLDPQAPWQPPPLKLDIRPMSGPILTTIEYRIREEDIPAFLEVMAERRRARLRDGARRWTLSRDIGEPEVWFERYKTATWVEHERVVQRRTLATGQLVERIRALHRGDKPKVRYELVRQPAAEVANRSDDISEVGPQ